jgi:hypothetical protein
MAAFARKADVFWLKSHVGYVPIVLIKSKFLGSDFFGTVKQIPFSNLSWSPLALTRSHRRI